MTSVTKENSLFYKLLKFSLTTSSRANPTATTKSPKVGEVIFLTQADFKRGFVLITTRERISNTEKMIKGIWPESNRDI